MHTNLCLSAPSSLSAAGRASPSPPFDKKSTLSTSLLLPRDSPDGCDTTVGSILQGRERATIQTVHIVQQGDVVALPRLQNIHMKEEDDSITTLSAHPTDETRRSKNQGLVGLAEAGTPHSNTDNIRENVPVESAAIAASWSAPPYSTLLNSLHDNTPVQRAGGGKERGERCWTSRQRWVCECVCVCVMGDVINRMCCLDEKTQAEPHRGPAHERHTVKTQSETASTRARRGKREGVVTCQRSSKEKKVCPNLGTMHVTLARRPFKTPHTHARRRVECVTTKDLRERFSSLKW